MRRVSQGYIRDVARRGWILLRLGNPLECSAVAVEALPSVNSDPAFPVPAWNALVHDCIFRPQFERLSDVRFVEGNGEIQTLAT